jgi:hypothetical protein
MPAPEQNSSTTQKFLDIYEITNNLVILKDGVVSFTLLVSAMNFGLLAEQEQDAIIYTYAALLNSLNFPIQIIIQSQTKDATQYLGLLQEQQQRAPSEQKANMIARYRGFVSQLIRERNVLDKKFYVTVPATPTELGLLGVDSVIPGKTEFDIERYEKSYILEKAQSVLEPRRDHLVSQFARIGLFARQLKTEEIIKVFYTNYNPEASEGLEIADSREYTAPLVQAQYINQAQGHVGQNQGGNSVQKRVNQTQSQTQGQVGQFQGQTSTQGQNPAIQNSAVQNQNQNQAANNPQYNLQNNLAESVDQFQTPAQTAPQPSQPDPNPHPPALQSTPPQSPTSQQQEQQPQQARPQQTQPRQAPPQQSKQSQSAPQPQPHSQPSQQTQTAPQQAQAPPQQVQGAQQHTQAASQQTPVAKIKKPPSSQGNMPAKIPEIK